MAKRKKNNNLMLVGLGLVAIYVLTQKSNQPGPQTVPVTTVPDTPVKPTQDSVNGYFSRLIDRPQSAVV